MSAANVTGDRAIEMHADRTASEPRASDFLDLARFTGFLCMVSIAVYRLGGAWNKPRISLTHEWMAVGAFGILFIIASGIAKIGAQGSGRRLLTNAAAILDVTSVAALCAVALDLLVNGHRSYVAIVIAGQSLMIYALYRREDPGARADLLARITAASAVTWVLIEGMTFTQLDDLLFGFAPVSPLFGYVLALAIVLLTYDLCTRPRAAMNSTRWRLAGTLFAVAVFAEFCLRTDAITTDWIPFHQSFFTDPVAFMRQGHWLLWDVPTQYGLLEIVFIALMPFKSVWQSYYLATALWTTISATLLFLMLRYRRSGVANYLIALLVALTVYTSSLGSRWPFGARLYPQAGLRFFPVLLVLACIFFEHTLRERGARSSIGRWLGLAAWILGCFWSFETGVWCTLTFGSYVVFAALAGCRVEQRTLQESALAAIRALLPLLVAIVAAVVAIDAYYIIGLRHLPDWLAYIEFSGIYSSGSGITFLPERSAWENLLFLGAIGAIAIYLLRKKLWFSFAALAAGWIAAWGASVYLAGEPYESHMAGILQVQAFVWALALTIAGRDALWTATLYSRIALASIWMLLIAAFLGQPNQYASARMPLINHYSFHIANDYPPVGGQLLELMRAAKITPDQPVGLPVEPLWVKIDLGLIMPFMRSPDGSNEELTPWFVGSPIGEHDTLLTLPLPRSITFTARFVDRLKSGGWYITFKKPAQCAELWPTFRNEKQITVGAYSAAYCVIAPGYRP